MNFARASANFSFAERERHASRATAICEFFPSSLSVDSEPRKILFVIKTKIQITCTAYRNTQKKRTDINRIYIPAYEIRHKNIKLNSIIINIINILVHKLLQINIYK